MRFLAALAFAAIFVFDAPFPLIVLGAGLVGWVGGRIHPAYFTAGSGRMTLGDDERDVGAGDCVVIPPGAVHGLVNTGTEPLVLLCCCAPAYSHDDTVLMGRQAPSG